MLKIVFFGTPEYVLPVLESLHKNFKEKSGESPIAAVVTQKPKPVGRRQILEYSPVDDWAHKRKIPIFFSGDELIKNKIKADIGVLAAYGEIISREVLNYSPFGILNIHPSILPKWRGASPVQASIISGEKTTGATIIKLDEKLDHGPIVGQFKEEISDDDTTSTLRERLFIRSAEVLISLLPAYIRGKIRPREQDHKSATNTHQIKKDDGFIPPEFLNAVVTGTSSVDKHWEIPFINNYQTKPTPENVFNFIRAMDPWPEAWTEIKLMVNDQWSTKRLKILKSHLESSTINHESLVIDSVQLEGKNPVSWMQFQQGYPNVKI